jgi:hypothetical protein
MLGALALLTDGEASSGHFVHRKYEEDTSVSKD